MKIILCFAPIMYSLLSHAQDERFYRKIFTKELYGDRVDLSHVKVEVKTPGYRWDLDKDGIQEVIYFIKRDGMDFVSIQDNLGRVIFEKKLAPLGKKSKVTKVTGRSLSEKTDVYIIHFYEGVTEHAYMEASAKLYFLTIDDRNLKNLALSEGPTYFHEKTAAQEVYWNRHYQLKVADLNNDGVKEISVNYKRIAKVYFYLDHGIWKAND